VVGAPWRSRKVGALYPFRAGLACGTRVMKFCRLAFVRGLLAGAGTAHLRAKSNQEGAPVFRALRSIAILVLPVIAASQAHATNTAIDVPAGATLPEVLALWGEPAEKIDRAVLHQTVWRYSDGAFVVFKEGRVINWKSSRNRGPSKAPTTAEAPRGLPEVKPTSEMGDLVRDIAREVPGGPDVPYSEPPPAANPPQLNLRANPVPGQPGGPGGAADGDADLEEVD